MSNNAQIVLELLMAAIVEKLMWLLHSDCCPGLNYVQQQGLELPLNC